MSKENELKIKLDIACELLNCALKLNKVSTRDKDIKRKWVEMSLKCSNK